MSINPRELLRLRTPTRKPTARNRPVPEAGISGTSSEEVASPIGILPGSISKNARSRFRSIRTRPSEAIDHAGHITPSDEDRGMDRLKYLPEKWRVYCRIIDAVLRNPLAGKTPLRDKERKDYAKTLNQILGNRSLCWSNVHRSKALWYANTVNVTFFLPSEVRGLKYRSGEVHTSIREGLRTIVDEALARAGAREGICLRCHHYIFDADTDKVPLHYHVWVLPYRFTPHEIDALQNSADCDPEDMLQHWTNLGSQLPDAERNGALANWLNTRCLTESAWEDMIEYLIPKWHSTLRRIFGLACINPKQTLVEIQRQSRSMIPNNLETLRRTELDLARITTYIENGPSITDRADIMFDSESGMVNVNFKHGRGSKAYSARQFCRRFLSSKSAAGMKTGVFHGKNYNHAIMRVFKAAFSEMVLRRNHLLHCATLPFQTLLTMLKPKEARHLAAKAKEALTVLEPTLRTPETYRHKIWKKQSRFFTGEYIIVLYYLWYVAERVMLVLPPKSTPGMRKPKQKPGYLLDRCPLKTIKSRAVKEKDKADSDFNKWLNTVKEQLKAEWGSELTKD